MGRRWRVAAMGTAERVALQMDRMEARLLVTRVKVV